MIRQLMGRTKLEYQIPSISDEYGEFVERKSQPKQEKYKFYGKHGMEVVYVWHCRKFKKLVEYDFPIIALLPKRYTCRSVYRVVRYRETNSQTSAPVLPTPPTPQTTSFQYHWEEIKRMLSYVSPRSHEQVRLAQT